jgi:hypothetical protein
MKRLTRQNGSFLCTLVARTSSASFALGFSLIPGSRPGGTIFYLHWLAMHPLRFYELSFLMNSWHLVHTYVFFTFLTRACLAQISIVSFIVILFLSPTDETGCRVFIRCFLRTEVCPVIDSSSFWRVHLSRSSLPHPPEDWRQIHSQKRCGLL